MSFLNPLLLFGVIGIASPIIIHLLAKKQTKRVVWAAMRFLKVSVQRNQRRMNLEDILLLLMRCALLALLAFALARPVMRALGISAGAGSETAFILIDNSGSMSAGDGVETRFETARKAAGQVLDSLPGGSSAAVWLVSDVVKDVIPNPSHDLALARKAIRDAQRSDQGSDIPAAVRRMIEAARKHEAPQKHLYLITDSQSTAWKGTGAIRNLLEPVGREIATHIVLTSDGTERNIGVKSIRLGSALPVVNQPLRFEVTVSNHGTEAAANVAVSLAVNEEPPSDEQSIESIPAGEERTVTVFATFREAGFHAVTAKLAPDRCPFDDSRSFALRVINEVHVLLVDGKPGTEPRDSEVFYLRNALTPVPPEMLGQFFIKTKTVTTAEFESATLRDFDAIALANVVDLPPAAVASLDDYVKRGGGLMVFPGDRISPTFYNERLHSELGLLPAAFGEPHGELATGSAQQMYFHLQSRVPNHRITLPWSDPKAGSLSTAQFYRAFTLIAPKASDIPGTGSAGTVVLSFVSGAPAIMEKAHGLGRVVQFASTAGSTWTDLPVRPLYVPLIHRALGHLLARDEEQLNTRAGTKFSFPLRDGASTAQHTIKTPGGASVPGIVEMRDGVPWFHCDDTSLAGIYQAAHSESSDRPIRFAAYIDPRESDLTGVSDSDFKLLGPVARVSRWSPGMDLKKTLQTGRTGTEIWLWFAVVALALAVAETLLGNRWSRSK